MFDRESYRHMRDPCTAGPARVLLLLLLVKVKVLLLLLLLLAGAGM